MCESDYRPDRLSELPNSLILEILSLLETEDVVRTTILSKRWKDLWITVPRLDFYGKNPRFIDGVLARWRGSKLKKFSLFCWLKDRLSTGIVDSWLLVPIENKVEDLFLCLGSCFDPEYRLPQRLYSCSSISKLSLHSCELEIDENVQVEWNQLKSLKIDALSDLSSHAINRILFGAPLLEELCFSDIFEDIDIESTSLKMLTISMYMPDSADLFFDGNASYLRT